MKSKKVDLNSALRHAKRTLGEVDYPDATGRDFRRAFMKHITWLQKHADKHNVLYKVGVVRRGGIIYMSPFRSVENKANKVLDSRKGIKYNGYR